MASLQSLSLVAAVDDTGNGTDGVVAVASSVVVSELVMVLTVWLSDNTGCYVTVAVVAMTCML